MQYQADRSVCPVRRSWLALPGGWNCAACLIVGLAVCLVSGCLKQVVCNKDCLSEDLQKRMGPGLGPSTPPGQIVLPNGISLTEPLSDEMIIVVAMWNNAAFLELLTDLGVAHGDLIQAGLLPNPEFLYYAAAHDKAYRWLSDFPVEAIWLRPIRIKSAKREVERVCQRLAQAGLDLIRDVRLALADVHLAYYQVTVAEEAVRVRTEISNLAAARLKAGDIGPQEAATAQIDAYLADQDLARIRYNASIAEERLRNLMGTGANRCPIKLMQTPLPPRDCIDVEKLTAEALNTRPDLQSSLWNVQGAQQRLKLAKLVWFRFLGIADATTGTIIDHEFGPAFRVTIPIFNWNQGAIARAKAELERAERNVQTIRNQIIWDVHQAHYRYRQARAELEVLDARTLPAVEANITRAETAYREGQSGYVIILETSRALIDALFREALLHAELRRQWAELERSVGRRLKEAGPLEPEPDVFEKLKSRATSEKKDTEKKEPEKKEPEKKEPEKPTNEARGLTQGEDRRDKPGGSFGEGVLLPPIASPRRD